MQFDISCSTVSSVDKLDTCTANISRNVDHLQKRFTVVSLHDLDIGVVDRAKSLNPMGPDYLQSSIEKKRINSRGVNIFLALASQQLPFCLEDYSTLIIGPSVH